jgi:voltage-gated potassium channel
MTEQLVDVWERRTEWPLTVAAVLFLGAFAWPILDIHLTAGWRQGCKVVVLAAWVVFVVDYLIRVSLARRWDYWWRHIPDLAILALPALRPLRLLRVVMLLKILNRNAASNLRGRIAAYVVGATGLLLLCSALAVLDAERHHAGANIHNFGDALWWSITTITTVGYGDRFPVSHEGRAVAVALMLGGVALLGVVTAGIASWLLDEVRDVEESAQAVTRADLAALSTQITELQQAVAALNPGQPGTGGRGASPVLGRG